MKPKSVQTQSPNPITANPNSSSSPCRPCQTTPVRPLDMRAAACGHRHSHIRIHNHPDAAAPGISAWSRRTTSTLGVVAAGLRAQTSPQCRTCSVSGSVAVRVPAHSPLHRRSPCLHRPWMSRWEQPEGGGIWCWPPCPWRSPCLSTSPCSGCYGPCTLPRGLAAALSSSRPHWCSPSYCRNRWYYRRFRNPTILHALA